MRKILRDTKGAPVSFNEGKTGRLTATFDDYTGTQITLVGMTTLTMTIYDVGDGAGPILKTIQAAIDVKNANGGAVAADGTLTQTISAAQNVLVDSDKINEEHVIRFDWSWSAGTGSAEYSFRVIKTPVLTP